MKRHIRKGSDFLLKWLWHYRKEAAVILLALLLLVVFADIIIPAAAILTMAVIATFSTSYKRVIRIPPAIELVTFTTIMVALAFGPVIGAVYAAVVTLSAEIMTNALDVFIMSFIPSRVVIALTAGFFFSLFDGNIFLAGVSSTVLYNALAQPFYLFMADVEMRAKSAYFLFLNIGSNFALFAVLGKPVATLLGIL